MEAERENEMQEFRDNIKRLELEAIEAAEAAAGAATPRARDWTRKWDPPVKKTNCSVWLYYHRRCPRFSLHAYIPHLLLYRTQETHYYINHRTNTSQWQRPDEFPEEEELCCGICLEEFAATGTRVKQCRNGHLFCEACLAKHLQLDPEERKCPECRVRIEGGGVRSLVAEKLASRAVATGRVPASAAAGRPASRDEVRAVQSKSLQEAIAREKAKLNAKLAASKAALSSYNKEAAGRLHAAQQAEAARAAAARRAHRQRQRALARQDFAEHFRTFRVGGARTLTGTLDSSDQTSAPLH